MLFSKMCIFAHDESLTHYNKLTIHHEGISSEFYSHYLIFFGLSDYDCNYFDLALLIQNNSLKLLLLHYLQLKI
jgi:hypothetical protein